MGMVRPGPGFGQSALGSQPMGGFGGQPPMPMTQPPMGGFGGPVQPGKSGIAGSDFSGRGGTGFGGPPSAAGTPFNKPPMPMTQPPMGGFGGQPKPPGMGQQSSPYDMMQRFQQMQQMMPQGGQQPQKPVSAARQFLDARQQYLQGGSQGARPTFAQFQQQQQLGGMPPMGQPMDRQKQIGGGYSPEMQAYYAQDAANQAQRGQMMQFMQQQQQNPMQSNPMQQGGMQTQNAAQNLALNNELQAMGKPGMSGAFRDQMQQQNPMQFGQLSQMQQQALGVQQPMAQQQPMRMNMGGSVGMAPPNPYEQQVGQEDPRMQAMRNMQQMNFGG